jgi:PAS domain S-box-containing protein
MAATTPVDDHNDLGFVRDFGADATAAEIRIAQSVQAQGSIPSLATGLVAGAAVTCYLDWRAVVSSHAIYFIAVSLIMLVPMLGSYFRLRGLPRPKTVSKRRIRRLETFTYLFALVWAAIIFLVLGKLSPLDAAVAITLTFSLVFGSVALNPTLPKAASGFCAAVLMAAFAGAYVNDVVRPDLLIVLFITLALILARTIWQNWRDVQATVRVGLEKLQAEADTHERETGAIRSILEAIPFPLVVTHETGALHASSQARRQFGVAEDAPLNIDIREFFVDPAGQARMGELQDTHGRLEEFEVQFKNAQGELFWASLSTLPIKYEGLDCWLNAIYVIDDRKRAEKELEEKTHLLSHVLDTVAQGVVKYGADRKLVIWNQHYQDALDLPDELINMECSINDIALFVARRGDYGDGYPEALADQRVEFLFRGEETRSEIVIGNRTYDALCQPTDDGGIVVTYTDVTESKRAEAELSESREVLQALADNMPAFISFKDLEGRFQFVNKLFEEWVCIGREEIEGKTVHDVYDEEQATRFAAQDNECMARQEVVSREIPLAYPDGKTRTVVSTRFPVITADGEPLGLGTVNYDISERKAMEEALRESERRLIEILDLSPIAVSYQSP